MFHRRRPVPDAPLQVRHHRPGHASSAALPGAVIRPIYTDSELDWLPTLEIAMAEIATDLRLAPQMSVSKMVALPDQLHESARRILRHRTDFALIDRYGFPVAVIEVASGSQAQDRNRALRWHQTRPLLEGAGIACFEITARTTIEDLFIWIARIAGIEPEVEPEFGSGIGDDTTAAPTLAVVPMAAQG